ncbi:uncharacterized protein [Diadema antillarum]|uniref:uncharacterized protein n=1 Tax=Diadema antillarum TaxID=105358 RepID=UPI003A8588C0
MDSLENLCLDRVVELIPSVRNELAGLPVTLLRGLVSRCEDFSIAVIHDIAVSKGLDVQAVWRDLCRDKFSWFYRHKFQRNLHDPIWQCYECHMMTCCDPQAEVIDWHQTYLDKMCEGRLEDLHTKYTKEGGCASKKNMKEDMIKILKNPFHGSRTASFEYHPRQLLLNLRTVVALTQSPAALHVLAQSLRTLMCRVQVMNPHRDAVALILEKFVATLLAGRCLETVLLKEQQIMREDALDYSNLFTALLLEGWISSLDASTGSWHGQDREREVVHSVREFRTCDEDPWQKAKESAVDQEASTLTADEGDDGRELGEDLFDFCFRVPIRPGLWSLGEELAQSSQDVELFCEEGQLNVGEENGSGAADAVEEDASRDTCCHYADPDCIYFHHALHIPASGPSPQHSISTLVLVYVRLSSESCSTLSTCLAHTTSLKSLALIQCTMPPCGWCEVLSGLACGSQNGLLLDDLALTCRGMHGVPPKSTFGQYCAQKLDETLATYHRRGHKMTSLKLELLLSYNCQAAETSFLPQYLPYIRRLTLNCWGMPLPQGGSNPHPLHQLVQPRDLASALPGRDSCLTDLLLDNLALETGEMDTILAAASGAVHLKRISMKNNVYTSPQPRGFLALLRHPTLHSLNICKCKFSLKACEKTFQEEIVASLIDNHSLRYLNLSDGILDDSDLAILARGFRDTKRTVSQPGYCLNICLSRFSRTALADFAAALQKDGAGHHSNCRPHSLDHLALDWRCVHMVKTLRMVIPHVSFPHRLS